MADELLEIGSGDALLVIAHERVTPELEVPLDVAREAGLPVVLLTDSLALALEGRYTVALSARRGGPETYPFTGVTFVVVEALLVGIAARDRARTLASFERLNDLRERLNTSRP
jgi:DNA-binding MurR/RpiR family transcriptional regulator